MWVFDPLSGSKLLLKPIEIIFRLKNHVLGQHQLRMVQLVSVDSNLLKLRVIFLFELFVLLKQLLLAKFSLLRI